MIANDDTELVQRIATCLGLWLSYVGKRGGAKGSRRL